MTALASKLQHWFAWFRETYPTRRSEGARVPYSVKMLVGIQLLILLVAGSLAGSSGAIKPALSTEFLQYLAIVFFLSLAYQSVSYRADRDYLVSDTSEIIILSSIVLFQNLFFTVVTVLFYMLSHFIFGMRAAWQFTFNTCNSMIAGLISFHIYMVLQPLISTSTTTGILALAFTLYATHYLIAMLPVLFAVSRTMQQSISHVAANLFDKLDEAFQFAVGVTTLVFFILLPDLYYLLFLLLFLLFSQQIQRQVEIKSRKLTQDKLTKLEHERELDALRYRKLEALQSLAGKVAHDINNYLTIISGNLDMLRMENPDQSAELDHIETGVENTKNIINELLQFSAIDRLNVSNTELNKFLQNVLEFTLSSKTVSIDMLPSDKAIFSDIDRNKLTQAISNIVINATQAMNEGGKIETRIETASTVDGGEDDTVMIHISDNGKGIPEEYRERIFEPYFTTRSEGSGLGMASAHAIVTAHGGTLTFDSIEGEGTTFTISLPLTEAR